MIPGFGKQTITIGSDPGCDVVLTEPGVAPEHAHLRHDGGGKLVLIHGHHGTTTANGRAMAPGEQAAFDFRTQFRLGEAPLAFEHPPITLMLMAHGQQTAPAGQLTIGRDPTRASLVIQHPSVSSVHALVALDRMMVTDQGSTSGTYVAGARVPANQPSPIPPDGCVYFGPVPVRVDLLMQVAHATRSGGAATGAAPQIVRPQQPTEGLHAGHVGAGHAGAGHAGAGHAGAGHAGAGHAGHAGGAAAAAAGPSPAPMRKNKTVFGELKFDDLHKVKTIGRTDDNDITLPHPQVSSHHAQVSEINGQLYVEDRGSANGTYVRGARIQPGQKVAIGDREKIYIGPMPLQLHISASGAVEAYQEEYGLERWAGRPLYEIEGWSIKLEVPDREDTSQMKVLLDDVSFKALPGDMIALMGPSGAGKTTLLLTLNGYTPPTEGIVRINGENLYDIYDILRGSIGYVPQDDLVHPELTVEEAVRYSAKFRLPPDYSNDEIDARVRQTLVDLGLEGVAHLQIGEPEKKILSGGQRKRVNIALELVTDPVIVYLDEPTSGLASDDAAGLITLLSDLTKATGKTIIMTIHQPAKEEFEKFTHCFILGYGGVPMFYGRVNPDAYQFFGRWKGVEVDNPRDLFAIITERETPIYQQLLAQDPRTPRGVARNLAAQQWKVEYFSPSNPTYMRMYSGRRAVGTGDAPRGLPEGRPQTRGQFRLLLSRYFKTKWRDVSGTVIMFAQAPIIGILLAAVFRWQQEAAPAWCLGALQQLSKKGADAPAGDVLSNLDATKDQTGAIFFLVVSAIWFGTSNAAREIVKERAIYLRERMVNLGLFNYVFSKFLLLSLFCLVQCATLLAIVFVALEFEGGAEAFLWELGGLTATAVCAVALGLVVSTLVTSSEAAQALTPIALIPQVVLGGLIVPATTIPALSPLMNIIPARWGFEAAIRPERMSVARDAAWIIDLQKPNLTSADDFIEAGRFECAIAQMASDELTGAWAFTTYETTWLPFAVLAGMTLGLLICILFLLKRRDRI